MKRIEGVLNQTVQMQEGSREQATAAEGAGEQLESVMGAVQTYKDTQAEQQNLFLTAQAEGQADIQSGMDTYNETIEAAVQDVNEKVQKQSVAYADRKIGRAHV